MLAVGCESNISERKKNCLYTHQTHTQRTNFSHSLPTHYLNKNIFYVYTHESQLHACRLLIYAYVTSTQVGYIKTSFSVQLITLGLREYKFHRAWALARADRRIRFPLHELAAKAAFRSVVAMRFIVWAAHLWWGGRAYLLSSCSSIKNKLNVGGKEASHHAACTTQVHLTNGAQTTNAYPKLISGNLEQIIPTFCTAVSSPAQGFWIEGSRVFPNHTSRPIDLMAAILPSLASGLTLLVQMWLLR